MQCIFEHIINKQDRSILCYKMQYFCFVCFSDEETAIMHRLQSTILEYSEVLLSVMDYCAELDW